MLTLETFVNDVNCKLSQLPKINRPIAPNHPKVRYEEDIFGHFPLLVWVMSNYRKKLIKSGIWCEFGVFKGESISYLSEFCNDAKLYGFDTFKGLPEDWIEGAPKGYFATDIPDVPQNVELIIGLYNDTLKTFDPKDPVMFCHVDCDLYSSSKTVLEWLKLHVISGSVVLFDEILTQPYDNGEMRALFETWQDVQYEWVASGMVQAVLVIK